MLSDAFQKKGVPQALANPLKSENKSNNHLPTKKISEKVKSVSSVQSVFNFLSIAVGVWPHCYHRYNLFRGDLSSLYDFRQKPG